MGVNTVLGPIHPEQIGIASMHEHILWSSPGWQFSPEANELFNPPEIFQRIYNELIDYKEAGGQTIVDCTGIGLGRDIEFNVFLAKSSGVNIVASTGFWDSIRVMHYFLTKGIDYLTDLFVKELTRGMGTTNVKAGVIKVGNGKERMTPFEEMTYRAAARASRATGAAIITHGIQFAIKQTEILLEEKVDPEKVVISHCDSGNALDFERDKCLAEKGFNVGYDLVGIEPEWSLQPFAMSDSKRVELCKAFIEAGYAKKLIISCDHDGCRIGLVYCGTPPHGYSYLLKNFVPRLRSAGISEETIRLLLIENPKRILPF